eukprot:3666301-Rhodomonas_salina.1
MAEHSPSCDDGSAGIHAVQPGLLNVATKVVLCPAFAVLACHRIVVPCLGARSQLASLQRI